MPELPEVETVRRQLAKRLEGATIVSVHIWQSDRELPKAQAFVSVLKDKVVSAIERRGKLLLFRFSDQTALTVHLKMTGKLIFYDKKPTAAARHERLFFAFKNGTEMHFLAWKDLRRFGYLKFHSDPKQIDEILAEYGPEPLSVSAQILANGLKKSSTRSIKSVLLDQSVIAGIGNIYADEACFLAGIHPARPLKSLSDKERLLLAEAVQDILTRAVEQRGTSAHDYLDTEGQKGGFLKLLQVYGRKNQPCRKCKTLITKSVLAGRGTHVCLKCQK